jgi:predicted N-acetyltransferase YhbS
MEPRMNADGGARSKVEGKEAQGERANFGGTTLDEIVIREVKPEDVERLVEIAVKAWTPIYDAYRRTLGNEMFEAAWPGDIKEKARQVRQACDVRNPAMVLVAEKDGRVAGFVTFYLNNRSLMGEIGNNAVDAEFRGMGIAPRMYEEVFTRMRRFGMRFAKVQTGGDPAYAPARKAYEKAAFSLQLPGVTYFREL